MRVIWMGMLIGLLSACSQQGEKEEEPDYENMVMGDEDELSDEERDRKEIVSGKPDPQELMIIEKECTEQDLNL